MTTDVRTSTDPALSTAPWLMAFDDDPRRIAAVPATVAQHTALVHHWMQEPHVAPWWDLDGPIAITREYLAEQVALPHVQPWIASIDRQPFAYVETYLAARDPLAAQLAAAGSHVVLDEHDRGFHLLVGNPQQLGTGAAQLLGRAVVHHLFTDPDVQRVVCEPDRRNERMLRYCAGLGHDELDRVDLPAKRAVILAVHRKEADA